MNRCLTPTPHLFHQRLGLVVLGAQTGVRPFPAAAQRGTHRHRYFGVLAPNSPLRAAVTALAAPVQQAVAQAEPVITGEVAPGVAPLGSAVPTQPAPVPPKRSPAHYLWAVLIARLLRPCGTDRSYAQRTSSVLN